MQDIRELIEIEGECGSNLEQNQGGRALSTPPPLKGTRQPYYLNQTEKAYHRTVAFLVAEGLTDVEIAEQVNKSVVTIANLRKQTYIEQQVLALIHGRGDAAIDKLHRAAEEAADALIDNLRQAQGKESLEVVRRTANDILDRKYGKPNQPTTTTIKKQVEEMTIADIDQRISELQRQREIKVN